MRLPFEFGGCGLGLVRRNRLARPSWPGLGAGAVVGQYKVTVRKMETTGIQADPDGVSGEIAPEGILETWHTPQRYADVKRSKLAVEVKTSMDPVEWALTSP